MIAKPNRIAVPVLVAAIAGSAALLLPAVSAAETAPYGCACLHNNKVGSPINYRFKWGTGDWKTIKLGAGSSEWMCWTYKDAPKSPELLFQLDVDMTSNAKWETFSIKRVQAKDKSCSAIGPAGHYHVGYVAGSNKKKIQIFGGKS